MTTLTAPEVRDPRPAPAGAAKVRLRGIAKQFTVKRRTVDALIDIELDVNGGEFLCIVGPSGCGKTTLLRILAGLERPSAGSIEIGCESPSSRPVNSMVFQEQSIFPWMSVRDNIAFGLKARGISRTARHRVADAFIHTVGLSGFEDALPHQLSGGMKQRVSIARAFANDPEILLMDEPFASLDEQTRLILQAELVRMCDHLDRVTHVGVALRLVRPDLALRERAGEPTQLLLLVREGEGDACCPALVDSDHQASAVLD